jgi:hypothetical protein
MPLIRQILATGDFYYTEPAKLSPASKIFDMDITPQVLFQFWPQYAWESSFQPDTQSYFLSGFNNSLLKWNFIQMQDFSVLTRFLIFKHCSQTHTHTQTQMTFLFLNTPRLQQSRITRSFYKCNSASASLYTRWQEEMKIIMCRRKLREESFNQLL